MVFADHCDFIRVCFVTETEAASRYLNTYLPFRRGTSIRVFEAMTRALLLHQKLSRVSLDAAVSLLTAVPTT